MSDRRMRLKYLTKMKIILCIFLLYITAVSVFGESQELNSIVGKSIEFPAAVKTNGYLMYSSVTIGDVHDSSFTSRIEKYKGRVHWDSSTGHFSLSGLRLNDSGVYNVQNDGQKSVSFSLTVWIPVSKPHLNVTRNEYRCIVLCIVERGTGATLTLYKNSEKKPYVTSPVESAPNLHLPQTVESGTYTCEAKNSVSRETSDPLTVGAHCTAPTVVAPTVVAPTDTTIWILIAVVVYFLFAPGAYFLCRRFYPPASSSTGISAIIFAVVALFIAVVFAVLYHPHAKPTIWIVIAFFVFLLFAAVAYFLWRRFCHTTSKPEDTKNELEESHGLSKGNDEL